jgi:hypothetical protein
MRLIYFDENKYSIQSPYFFIGGIAIDSQQAATLEDTLRQIQFNFFGTAILAKQTELHGKDAFHGKGPFKRRALQDRVALFEDVATFIVSNQIPVRIVCIDVPAHRAKYTYPMPTYRLGLMLILERFCDYLDTVDDLGVVFGDYEEEEITNSILDFSQFKFQGKTSLYFGRPLGRLIDTIYFTHSHHSRFLQIADMLIFMANRYEHGSPNLAHWHETKVKAAWDAVKAGADFRMQTWP